MDNVEKVDKYVDKLLILVRVATMWMSIEDLGVRLAGERGGSGVGGGGEFWMLLFMISYIYLRCVDITATKKARLYA